MLAPASFDMLKQRHQSFAQDLAGRGFNVTYVEPLKAGGLSLKTIDHSTGLKIVQIKVPLRCTGIFSLHSLIVKLAGRLFFKKNKINPEECILWISEPSMAHFCHNNWNMVLYDRCDLHGHFPGQKITAWRKYEKLLFERAEIISVSHPELLDDIPSQSLNKTLLCRNACSDIFSSHSSCPPLKPPPIKFISSGAHYEWIDCGWLKQFAGLKDCELHIAGRGRGKDFTELIKLPGVVFHGELKHEQLADLMRSCHIGLLPFKDIELVKCVDPIKAYEYAASGLQIWGTDIAPMRSLDLVTKTVSQLKVEDLEFETVCTSDKIAVWSDRLNIILKKIMQIKKAEQ